MIGFRLEFTDLIYYNQYKPLGENMIENSVYDPNKHDGLLSAGDGTDVIIADAKQAKLHEIPSEIKEQFREATQLALAIVDGFGGVIVPTSPESKREIRKEGYRRGLKLLNKSED